jgi:magnesium-transporting ATPase (P-type)
MGLSQRIFMMSHAWHTIATERVLRDLQTDTQHGLQDHEAAQRLAETGPNELEERGGTPPWLILWQQFTSTMVLVLIAAAVISGFLGKPLETAAHAAGKTDTYLGEKYRRLSRRQGKKRAAVAVARTILVIVYHIMRDGTHFVERGSDFFDQLKPQSTQQWLTRRLERLGFKVTLEPIDAAA